MERYEERGRVIWGDKGGEEGGNWVREGLGEIMGRRVKKKWERLGDVMGRGGEGC